MQRDVLESILSSALWAPTGDNCQPWSFVWSNNRLAIYHDEERAEHAFNHENLASYLSLGTLLRYIRIAASQHQLSVKVEPVFQKDAHKSLWAFLSFVADADVLPSPLFPFLSKRVSDRRLYEGGALQDAQKNTLESLVQQHPGVGVHFCDPADPEIVQYIQQSDDFMWQNNSAFFHVLKWMRLTEKEVEKYRDGMPAKSLGVSHDQVMTLRLLQKWPGLYSVLKILGMPTVAKWQLAKQVRSSGTLILISRKQPFGATDLVGVGEAAVEIWLTLTSMNQSVQLLSLATFYLIRHLSDNWNGDYSVKDRAFFDSGHKLLKGKFKLHDDQIPVWIMRTGKTTKPYPDHWRTVRKPLNELLTYELNAR